jgi:radical SAM superfamily enzyme YgiQ (UPF0313 family)
VAPQDFRSPSIDLTVVGEGVRPLRQIVRSLKSGAPFAGIPGVVTAGDDPFVPLDEAVADDLDALPEPARHLTAAHRSQYFCDWMRPLASIRTSKGCPYRCKFCALWKLTCGKYLKRSPERVVHELAGIAEENVFFADDESLIDSQRMMTLARLIGEAGIQKRYFLYGRSDTIARNPELLEAWRKIGLTRVFVGLEFFRDEDLAYVDKRSTISDNEKAVAILRDLDIDIYASLMLRPEFDRRDFRALRRYCRSLGLDYPYAEGVLQALRVADQHRADATPEDVLHREVPAQGTRPDPEPVRADPAPRAQCLEGLRSPEEKPDAPAAVG